MNVSVLPRHAALSVDRERRFVMRVHGLRTLGLGLGFFPVAAVFWQNGEPLLLWALLLVNGFVWPHLARWLAARSATPVQIEYRNLLADSLMGGVWVALMRFNLLPSVALVAMLAMDKLSVGGARLLLRGLALQVLACALVAATNDWAFAPHTGTAVMLATVPFMVLYPLAISAAMHRLARQVRQQNRQLAQTSSTDGLSDLFNRGAWEEAVAAILERSRRTGASASLLMIDIDSFKHVNDRHGHPAGDAVIGRVGAIIRRCMRDTDCAGRYGGDEFGVLLDRADASAAAVIAERIRASVAAAEFEQAEGMHCTLSIGVAEITPQTHDARSWIKRADDALYRAKINGRNRTAC